MRRTYGEHGDACRAANALDLVGDRWTLIVVRELLLGPKRFADLQESVLGITPAVLTDRLRSLQEAGVVETVDLGRSRAYAATEWGRGLEDVLQSLGRWYSAGPGTTSGGMTPDAVLIAMRTMGVSEISVKLRLFDRRMNASIREYGSGTTTVTADSTTWARILFDGLPPTDIRVEGSVADVEALIRTVRERAAATGTRTPEPI